MHVYGEMLTNQRASEVSRVTYVRLFVYPVAGVQREPDVTQSYNTQYQATFRHFNAIFTTMHNLIMLCNAKLLHVIV